MAATGLLDDVLKLVVKFVHRHNGTWEHSDWEVFLADAADLGIDLTDEARLNLGNMLEGAKYLFALEPATSNPAPEASAKPKAKASAKKKNA